METRRATQAPSVWRQGEPPRRLAYGDKESHRCCQCIRCYSTRGGWAAEYSCLGFGRVSCSGQGWVALYCAALCRLDLGYCSDRGRRTGHGASQSRATAPWVSREGELSGGIIWFHLASVEVSADPDTVAPSLPPLVPTIQQSRQMRAEAIPQIQPQPDLEALEKLQVNNHLGKLQFSLYQGCRDPSRDGKRRVWRMLPNPCKILSNCLEDIFANILLLWHDQYLEAIQREDLGTFRFYSHFFTQSSI